MPDRADDATIFVNTSQLVTCAGPARARRGAELDDTGIIQNGCLAVRGGRIERVGTRDEIERSFPRAIVTDCGGRVLTPGLIDSHTHAVFGKPRYEEQEERASGVGYMEIARRGGGIHSSVRDLRARSEDELLHLTSDRIARLGSYGATTIEIKSGYGLSLDDELKTLRVVRRLQQECKLRLVPTWLGAHEIPLEFRETGERQTRLHRSSLR